MFKICPACRFDRCDETATTCRQCGSDLVGENEPDQPHQNLVAAWFHYLQIPDLGTLELVPGRAFLFGSDPRADLLIKACPDKEAARVFWTDGYTEATLQPNKGSKWTIKIDGIYQAKDRVLKGGEEISIGPTIHLKYLKRGTIIEGARKMNRRSKAPPGAGTGARGGGVRGPRTNKGGALEPNRRAMSKPTGKKPVKIAQAPPAAVARKLESTKAYGTLRVKTARGKGWIAVSAGVPKHASFGDLRGPKALEAILRLGAMRVEIDEEFPKRGATKDAIEGLTFSAVLAKFTRKAPSGRRPAGKPSAGKPIGRPKRGPTRPGGKPRPRRGR